MNRHTLFKFIIVLCLIPVLISCGSPEDNYQNYLKKGDTYFDQGDYIRARLEYKNAAKLMPVDPLVIYKLGLVEEAEGNFRLAYAAFTTAEQQETYFEPVLLKLAEYYLTGGQYEEARQRIAVILEHNPDQSMAHAINASLYLRENLYSRAREEANIALNNNPDNAVAYSVRAGIHMANDDYQKALEVLDEGLTQIPDTVSFHLLKAAIYSERKNIDAVVKTYSDIFELTPNAIHYRFDLAEILQTYDRQNDIITLYRETLRLFPDNLEAKRRYVTFLEREAGYNNAITELKRLSQQDPDQPLYYLWLADFHVKNNNSDAALASLEKLIAMNPDNWLKTNVDTYLAEIRLQEGDLNVARTIIDRVLAEDINNENALFLRANLEYMQGDYQKAVTNLRTINSQGNNLKASRMLAEALLTEGRIDLAIDTLAQAMQAHPENTEVKVRLAQLYSLQGNDNKAEDILSVTTSLDPNNALVWESYARLAIQNKDVAQAETSISKLEDLNHEDSTIMFLQGQLEDLKGNKDQAVQFYRSLIQDNPVSSITPYALSALLNVTETDQHKIETRDFLLALKTENPTIQTVIGDITVATGGNIENAEMAFRTAINNDPLNQAPYISLANLLIEQNLREEAISILIKASDEKPAELKAKMMLAKVLINGGAIDDGISLYEQILDSNGNIPAAANNMANAIAVYRHTDPELLERARIISEQFINSDNPYFLDTLGWVYYRLGLYTQASNILDKAVSLLNEPHAEIYYHYGAVLHELEQSEKAKEYLQTAVTENSFQGHENAKKLLDQID